MVVQLLSVQMKMNTFNIRKKLLKVINILGKDSKTQKNIPLFFIYENGFVEKKIIID